MPRFLKLPRHLLVHALAVILLGSCTLNPRLKTACSKPSDCLPGDTCVDFSCRSRDAGNLDASVGFDADNINTVDALGACHVDSMFTMPLGLHPSAISWCDEDPPGVRKVTITYDFNDPTGTGGYTSAEQLSDFRALSGETLSAASGYMAITGGTATIHGVMWAQAMAVERIVYSTRSADTDASFANVFIHLADTYAGELYNPSPGYMLNTRFKVDAKVDVYEIHVNGVDFSGGTVPVSIGTWYTLTVTASPTTLSIVRNDLKSPYTKAGAFPQSTTDRVAFGRWGHDSDWDDITITGLVSVP